jgi:hypothetical protein
VKVRILSAALYLSGSPLGKSGERERERERGDHKGKQSDRERWRQRETEEKEGDEGRRERMREEELDCFSSSTIIHHFSLCHSL